MNPLDVVLVLLFIPGMIRGFSKGFLEQAITLAGIFVAIWVALHFTYWLYGILAQHLPKVPDHVLHILSSVILIVAVLGLFALISSLLSHVAEMAALGWLNRLLGLVLSLGVSALSIGLLVLIFDTLNERFSLVNSPWLRESVLYPLFRDGANAVFPMLKDIFSHAAETTTSAITTL